MSSVNSSDWPLIGYILAQDEYKTTYQEYIETFSKAYFNEAQSTQYNVNDDFDGYQTLLQEYVEAEENDYTFTSEREFTQAVEALKEHTTERYDAAQSYVGW